MKKKILWDIENEMEAINYDGTKPEIIRGDVYIKELGCNCNPASGSVCGGCVDKIVCHKIGTKYIWGQTPTGKDGVK